MPFTLSHPSIVVPLYFIRKKYFSLTGLIIGSMIPDIKFFTSVYIIRNFSHNWEKAYWLGLPISLLLCFVFHNVIREPLIHYSPSAIGNRFSRYERFNWNRYFLNNWLIIILSILIGIYSHLMLDGFTHLSFNMLSSLTGFSTEIVPENEDLIYYRIIQSLYSLAGLVAEIYIIGKLPVDSIRKPKTNITGYWSTIVCLSLIFYVSFGAQDFEVIEEFIGFAIAAIFLALFFTSILYRIVIKKFRTRSAEISKMKMPATSKVSQISKKR